MKKDQSARPDLFRWYGPVQRCAIERASAAMGLSVPPELLALLSETGGGVFFETETLFTPIRSDNVESDDWFAANQRAARGGCDPGMWVFHEGLAASAFYRNAEKFLVLHSDYTIATSYASLGLWYADFVRKEYAGRYGL